MSVNYKTDTFDNETINITVYGEENLGKGPNVIYAHGFKGFKDWGFVPEAGKILAESGCFVVTFNFSRNGIEGNSTEFTRIDKFAENTLSREVDELNTIIELTISGYFGPVSNQPVFLLGHSRGGGVALLCAGHRAVKGLITWAAIAKADRFSERQKKDWLATGFFEVVNQRTGQVMRMNKSFLEDLNKNIKKLDLIKAAEKLNKEWLILHGDQDLAVPLPEAEMLYEASDKNITELKIIEGAGHTFNTVHPFQESNNKFDYLLEQTIKFIRKIK